MGTMCSLAPAAAYSSAKRGAAGTATWQVQPSPVSWRIIVISAVSEPPPSAVGWIERRLLVRVALNVEQLLSSSPGGIGRYTSQLATLLASVQPTDEVIPLVARHPRDQVRSVLTAAGVRAEPVVIGLPRQVLYQTWNRYGRPGLRIKPPVDIVHAPSVAVPGRGRTPLVVTVHDAAAELYPEAFTAVGRRFHIDGAAAAARRADLVIAVSQAAADEIVANTPIPADKIRVVHHGVQPPELSDAEAHSYLAGRALADREYLLWVGSLEPRKDVATLLSAVVSLRKRGKSTPPVVLAGFRGWLNAGTVSDEMRQVLGEDLVQLGAVTDPELWSLYRGATLVALPSRHEGFGLTAIEAMTQGTVVVASDLPVTRETLGDAAVRVPVGDVEAWAGAIEGIVADPTGRQRLGEQGRAWAGQYTVARLVAGTRAVYREAIDG
jgi:glycosyltransferase involved in cell wall biosynthesis